MLQENMITAAVLFTAGAIGFIIWPKAPGRFKSIAIWVLGLPCSLIAAVFVSWLLLD